MRCFLVGAQWSTHGWMAFHCILATHVFISPPVDGHLSCFQFGIIINTVLQIFWYLEQWSPTFLARDRFPRRQLFYGWGWGGRFWDDSSMLHSLCTLSLLLSHQLHLGPSGMRFCRLGTPVLEHICRFFSVEGMKCCAQKSFERTHLDKCGWWWTSPVITPLGQPHQAVPPLPSPQLVTERSLGSITVLQISALRKNLSSGPYHQPGWNFLELPCSPGLFLINLPLLPCLPSPPPN